MGLEVSATGDLARQPQTHPHPGVGLRQQMVEGGDAVDVGLGHAGSAVDLRHRSRPQAADLVETFQGLFASRVLGQNIELLAHYRHPPWKL